MTTSPPPTDESRLVKKLRRLASRFRTARSQRVHAVVYEEAADEIEELRHLHRTQLENAQELLARRDRLVDELQQAREKSATDRRAALYWWRQYKILVKEPLEVWMSDENELHAVQTAIANMDEKDALIEQLRKEHDEDSLLQASLQKIQDLEIEIEQLRTERDDLLVRCERLESEVKQLQSTRYKPHDHGVAVAGPNVPRIEQIDDLIRLLITIRHRWGNTAVSFNVVWGGSALWASDYLRTVIRECADRIGYIDNGYCAVCKIGYRELRDGRPTECSNEECLSHRITAAVGQTTRAVGQTTGDER